MMIILSHDIIITKLLFFQPRFTEATLAELKECFMEAYDDNRDGRIEIRELAQLLPLEESFLLLFRFDNPLESSVEFMKVRKRVLFKIRL